MNALPVSARLHLLNAPRLECDGVPVAVDRRKAMALLAYLVLSERTHLRDTLATLLWPDYDQTHARANLRRALFVLKRALGNRYFNIDQDRITLELDATFWVDVLHFQTLLNGCRAQGHPVDEACARCLPLLREAVAMPAEQFMAGFSLADSPAFDDWQRSQQQQLCLAFGDALARLVGYFIKTGDYPLATEYARRRLALDMLDEAAHRQLMQLYGWSGQQGLALRQFEQCTTILAQELAIPPSEETVRLMQEIRAGHVTAPEGHPLAIGSNGSTSKAEPKWRPVDTQRHNLPARLPTLIGRDHDLQTLQSMLQGGDIALVTLVGPGGVGKTELAQRVGARLLEHFADGVYFVPLAQLREPELVVNAIAQTLEIPRQPERPLGEAVKSYLRYKQLLLILDNYDHLIAAAPLISELLANCPQLRIEVTSRERLNVKGEYVYPVSPLALPEPVPTPSVAAIA